MAFLDNTGDIIIDAVLTDTGRKRLAQGDGSFRIVKFALSDDEIDYSLYRNSNSPAGRHPSGSAYYDLNILQTPVLEAFTNNTSLMKSKLVTYSRNDLLYLPVVKLNDGSGPEQWPECSTTSIAVDKNGENEWWTAATWKDAGYILTADKTTSDHVRRSMVSMNGFRFGDDSQIANANPILFEQGLDTPDLTVQKLSSGDLRRETQYLVEVDNRLLRLLPGGNNSTQAATPAFIDDDNVASYFFSYNSDTGQYFERPDGEGQIPPLNLVQGDNGFTADQKSVLGSPSDNSGRYGLRFGFRIGSSDSIKLSTKLFSEFGRIQTGKLLSSTDTTTQYRVIDTTIRVTGFTTGYRVDVPVRITKKV
jgi:hypothetical protein